MLLLFLVFVLEILFVGTVLLLIIDVLLLLVFFVVILELILMFGGFGYFQKHIKVSPKL